MVMTDEIALDAKPLRELRKSDVFWNNAHIHMDEPQYPQPGPAHAW